MVRPRSEKEKMINSELYHANSSELIAEREACKAACWRYNNVASNPNLGISEAEKGRLLLDIIRPGNKWEVVNTGAAPGTPGGLTYVSENGFTSDIIDVTVDAPFTCSYGYNIRLGKNVYIEFGCTILDSCAVTIKARTILSPGVSIYSATHPIDPRKRNGSRGPEMAKPVLIEEDCWLGGNVIVL
jgi:acetyltransferase-like isoleucine patch superfamily enzyme